MNVETVRKYIGKKVLIILNNNFKYTSTIPKFSGTSFHILDKFGKNVEIECEIISLIQEESQ